MKNMSALVIILAISCATCWGYHLKNIASSSTIDLRILKGKDAEEGQFPYQASLRVGNRHICGGSIIASQWILTAGHCIIAGIPQSKWSVVVGSILLDQGGTPYEVAELIRHEDYVSATRNDIALIKLKNEIAFSPNVQKIELETGEVDSVDCVISGWGTTRRLTDELPNHLQYLETKTLNNEKCLLGSVGASKICTSSPIGQGVCSGDSGGPVVANGKQIGLVSFGILTCATGLSTVHTRVSFYNTWIQETINRF